MKKFVIILCLLLFNNKINNAQQFKVSFEPSVYNSPFTGNVILYLSKNSDQPKNQLGYPCYRMKVHNIKPGKQIIFTDSSLSYPIILSRIDRGDYYVQAVWDLNIEGREIGLSQGNPYSVARKITINDPKEEFILICDKAVPTPIFAETKFVKEIKCHSAILSKFHNKPIFLNAAVILPAQYYEQPSKRFPVYFIVAGYGSDYHHYSSTESNDTLPSIPLDTIPCIKIYLDGNCSLGHSAYANSDNNGPVGDAFTYEFIPLLDKKFRTNGCRLIRGHSSGGWTVVYLLTHYPRLFAGGNASAPDPVDFHRFTLTNLYTDNKRVEFIDGLTMDKPDIVIEYDRPNIVHSIEDIIYRGQQNVSFDAVFGPRGKNGLPISLFNTATSEINRDVFTYWKRYDLTQYIIASWERLKKDMDGKLRISVGNEDNASLNFSVMLMEKEMKKLNAGIVFAYYPGNHFTVGTPEYKKAESLWLEQKYLEWLKINNSNDK
jgi:Putative esterase